MDRSCLYICDVHGRTGRTKGAIDGVLQGASDLLRQSRHENRCIWFLLSDTDAECRFVRCSYRCSERRHISPALRVMQRDYLSLGISLPWIDTRRKYYDFLYK